MTRDHSLFWNSSIIPMRISIELTERPDPTRIRPASAAGVWGAAADRPTFPTASSPLGRRAPPFFCRFSRSTFPPGSIRASHRCPQRLMRFAPARLGSNEPAASSRLSRAGKRSPGRSRESGSMVTSCHPPTGKPSHSSLSLPSIFSL